MPRQYSTKTFLRQAPNALLRRYFQKHEIGHDLPWDHLPETKIDRVFKTIEEAPETMRRRIDRDLREIYEMADEGGILESGGCKAFFCHRVKESLSRKSPGS